MNISVLLVDDSHTYRQAVERFLGGLPGVQHAGSVSNALEAHAAILSLKPDLVLMDIVMPWMDGFEATLQIKRLPAPPRVVMVTLYDNAEYRQRAEQVGADGFLPKSELTAGLKAVICQLFGGDTTPGAPA
jgi:DNA-binding NarL/FixJ family response regulator